MQKGDEVTWKWGQSEAEGRIVKNDEPVSKTIKGAKVKRNAH
ncbi:HVA1 family protein [Mucilaginibacter angelicae]|uniref:HVA1 family protein n=1 Tax=Mucilaginibacter angelicae TaxID=869718 RepID=A0ABV6L852_9SPHI